MENIYKLLHMAFNFTLFFIAVILLYKMNQQFISLTDRAAGNLLGDQQVKEAVPFKPVPNITRGILIATLMEDLEYDLEIIDLSGTYTIEKEGYSPGIIGLYSFSSELFQKSYVYHLNGEIEKIVFQYVTG